MLTAIKERKQEGQLLKYYANEKYQPYTAEWDKDGWLPIHWAGLAQCKPNVFEVLLEGCPDGAKQRTRKTKEREGGELALHLICQGTITADTEKALAQKIVDKGQAVALLVK